MLQGATMSAHTPKDSLLISASVVMCLVTGNDSEKGLLGGQTFKIGHFSAIFGLDF